MKVTTLMLGLLTMSVALLAASAPAELGTAVTPSEAGSALGGVSLTDCEILNAGCWVANNPAGGLACQFQDQPCYACAIWALNKQCEFPGWDCTQLIDVPCGPQYHGKCKKHPEDNGYWVCIPTGARIQPDCVGVNRYCA